MKCPYCKKTNWRSEERCRYCGMELDSAEGDQPLLCPVCKEENWRGDETCLFCGAKLDSSLQDPLNLPDPESEEKTPLPVVAYADKKLTYKGEAMTW